MSKRAKVEPDIFQALNECHGRITDLAKLWGITRQAAHKRVRKACLDGLAAKLRGEAGIPGPRTASPRSVQLDEKERARIVRALKKHDGNESAVARVLGVDRYRLRRVIARLGIG